MLVDDVNPGVFGSNQEMEMRVAPSGKRRLKGMIMESCVLEFMIGSWMNYLAGSSWVREKVVCLIYNFG